MKHPNKLHIALLLSILIISASSFVLASLLFNDSKIETTLSYSNKDIEIKESVIEDNLTKALFIAEEVAKYDYSRTLPVIFDCTQFSELLVSELKEAGFEAQCIYGIKIKRWTKGDSSFVQRLPHTWTRVEIDNKTYHIESIDAWLILDEEYKNNYEEKVIGKCI